MTYLIFYLISCLVIFILLFSINTLVIIQNFRKEKKLNLKFYNFKIIIYYSIWGIFLPIIILNEYIRDWFDID